MNPTNQRNSKIEICLCPRCASHFFQSVTHAISRADPIQVLLDTCDCCRTKRGYDFIIKSKYKQ